MTSLMIIQTQTYLPLIKGDRRVNLGEIDLGNVHPDDLPFEEWRADRTYSEAPDDMIQYGV